MAEGSEKYALAYIYTPVRIHEGFSCDNTGATAYPQTYLPERKCLPVVKTPFVLDQNEIAAIATGMENIDDPEILNTVFIELEWHAKKNLAREKP